MSMVRRIECITAISLAQNRRTEAGLPLQMLMRLLGLGSVVAVAGVALRTRARKLCLIGMTAELPTDMGELARLCSPIVEKVRGWALKDYTHSIVGALQAVGLSVSDSRTAAKLVHALEQIVLFLDYDHASPLGARASPPNPPRAARGTALLRLSRLTVKCIPLPCLPSVNSGSTSRDQRRLATSAQNTQKKICDLFAKLAKLISMDQLRALCAHHGWKIPLTALTAFGHALTSKEVSDMCWSGVSFPWLAGASFDGDARASHELSNYYQRCAAASLAERRVCTGYSVLTCSLPVALPSPLHLPAQFRDQIRSRRGPRARARAIR